MRVVSRPPRPAPAAFAGAVLLLLTLAVAWAATPVFPALTGRVVDEAGILSPATRSRLDDELAKHERATGEQVVVVTLASLQGYEIEDFGYQLGRHWGIGQRGRDNGALLIVAPKERKTRIEVGYGLEDRLTDAQSRIIIEQVMLPAFRRGDFDAGIREGAAAVLRVLGGTPVVGAQQQPPAASTAPRSESSGLPALTDWRGWLSLVLGYLFLLIFALWIVGFLGMGLFSLLFSVGSYRRGGFYHGGGFFSAGGSSGGGGFSGGGFSGGGGSFGGGGASGSW